MNRRPALHGIRVLDFTRAMAGPYGTQVLADFGADVVRIESVPQVDGVISDRGSGVTKINGESPMFMTYNRNKRSLCLDLRAPATRAVLDRLIGSADVLVQNFRPGVAERMGIGWEHAHELNERLIYVSINGFGTKGPWRDRQGIDVVIQAMSGVMSVTGEQDGDPVLCGAPVADFSTAMVQAQGVLLALLERSVSGVGQHVEVPMLAVAFSSLAHHLGPYFATGTDPVRRGSGHSQFAPFQAFRTADGYGIGGVTRERQWAPFCRVIGMPELIDDPRFAHNADRVAHREEIVALVAPRFPARTSAAWEEAFAEAGVPFGAVNSFSQALESEHADANDMITSVDHPLAGPFRMVAPPLRLSATPARVRRAAPLLGEHSRDVLADAGFGADEIDGLVADGVVVDGAPLPAAAGEGS
ncbi:MAG TPA: CoA transferase [Actinophytocola sp.]|jgi:formyl-CoA transferase/CoA:oxalate CoA-transferase|nr:CoA transferase [Actinophytocola sp.]